MARTAHGHQIPGSPVSGLPPKDIKRCGGPDLCPFCKTDVAEFFEQNEVIVRPRETPERSYLSNQSKVEQIIKPPIEDPLIQDFKPLTQTRVDIPYGIWQKIIELVGERFKGDNRDHLVQIIWFAYFDGKSWISQPQKSWRALAVVSNVGMGAYYEATYDHTTTKYYIDTYLKVSRTETER